MDREVAVKKKHCETVYRSLVSAFDSGIVASRANKIAIGAGAIIYSQVPRSESTDSLEVSVAPVVVGIRAGVGTLAGFFTRNGHKKGKLIYTAVS